ncbi:MAG: hypothetical protein AAF410_04615 [Pseudomonadota bacterium]
MKKIAITVPESAHWYAMLGRAEYIMRDSLPEDAAHYLVRLFFRQDYEGIVIFDGQNAFFSDDSNISETAKLQRLGDKCLLLCGFFPEFSQMYGVELQDWLDIGASSYHQLSTLVDEDEETVYQFLSENFSSVVELLAQMQQVSSQSKAKFRESKHVIERRDGFNLNSITGLQKPGYRQLN